jgi:hypothetical protein
MTVHIRDYLKQFTVNQLRDLVRRHNLHYRIRVGQSKEELLDSLADLYKSIRGDYLIPIDYEIRIVRPKLNIVSKAKIRAEAEAKAEELQRAKMEIRKNTPFERAKRMYLLHKKPEKSNVEEIRRIKNELKENELMLKKLKKTQV